MRIAFLLKPSGPKDQTPRVNPVIAEVISRLHERGARVDLIVPEDRPLDLAEVRPQHDLYVLKSTTPLALSLAGALTMAGAPMVNTYRSSSLARDKIAATALLAARGVPVPPSWATSRSSHIAGLLDQGPVWLKPHRGRDKNGGRRVERPSQLAAATMPTDTPGRTLPLLVQRSGTSRGSDLKVYVVADMAWAVAKPWPLRTGWDRHGVLARPPAEVRAAALACGRTLGLELYGVDFVRVDGRFLAVDVNAFPGFRGSAEAPRCLADYVYERALRPWQRAL